MSSWKIRRIEKRNRKGDENYKQNHFVVVIMAAKIKAAAFTLET